VARIAFLRRRQEPSGLPLLEDPHLRVRQVLVVEQRRVGLRYLGTRRGARGQVMPLHGLLEGLAQRDVDVTAGRKRVAGVFGVEPGYFLDGVGEPPILDREALDILRDETTSAIARKSFRLPGPEKRMILNIIDELENARHAGELEATKSSRSRPPA
jgi:hypothetical protein